MTHLNLYRGAVFLFLTLSLIMNSSVNPLYADEAEACIDFNTPYKRIGYGFDSQSYENAEQKAIKNMRYIANVVYPESCGGEPVVLCKENSRQDTIKGLNVYRARVLFACPSDEGISIENGKLKSFNYTYTKELLGDDLSTDTTYYVTGFRDQKMKEAFRRNCNLEPKQYSSHTFQIKLVSEGIIRGGGNPFIGNFIYDTHTNTIRVTCPSTPKITIDHEAIGKNKGNPDPRENWRYEKWWSGESFEAAKRKCDTKVVEKNLCRFRGGAVDITYKETRSEHYWVSLRYRCRYD